MGNVLRTKIIHKIRIPINTLKDKRVTGKVNETAFLKIRAYVGSEVWSIGNQIEENMKL